MTTLEIDLSIFNTKKKLLAYFASLFNEMYGLNYDALIDVLAFIKEPLTLELLKEDQYEDLEELKSILEIIHEENSFITIKNKS